MNGMLVIELAQKWKIFELSPLSLSMVSALKSFIIFFLGYSDLEYTWCCNKTLLQLDPMCYLMFQFFHFQSSSDGDWQQNKILFRVVKSSVYIIWLIRSWLIWVIPCYRSDMGHMYLIGNNKPGCKNSQFNWFL